MSTRRHPARWTSTHRARRAIQRWRLVRRHRWFDASDGPRALDLADEVLTGADCTAKQYRTSGHRDREATKAALAFVELFPALPASPADCTVELVEPGGRTLRISFRGAPGPDLVALTQSLWRALR